MSLVLRNTKGSALTHTELDGNFTYLDTRISGLSSSVDIAPYNGGTTYTGSVYVSYNGNVYLHISVTPTTGVIPSSDPTKWQLVSAGVLIHEKNKDTYLDFGGANQVSAADLKTLLDNQDLIIVSVSELSSLITSGTLIREATYLVSDNTPAFYAKAATSNSLYPFANAIRFIPKHTSVGGSYDYWNGGSYSIDDKVVFGNYVYKNKNGDNSGYPRTTTSDWEVVDPLTTPSDYLLDVVSAKVQQRKDYGFNGLIEFEDSDGNEFLDIYYPCLNTSNNKFISSRWFDFDIHVEGIFRNNIFMKLKSTGASISVIKGTYEQNVMNNSVLSANYYEFDGEFKENDCRNVILEMQTNTTSGFKFNRNIVDFSSIQGIPLRSSAVIEDCVINSKGSTAVDTLNGSTAVTGMELDLNANSANDAYGVFVVGTADIIIDSLTGFPSHFEKIILKPATGRVINYTTTTNFAVTSDGQLVDNGEASGGFDIVGDDSDYLILEKRVVNGFNCIHITAVYAA